MGVSSIPLGPSESAGALASERVDLTVHVNLVLVFSTVDISIFMYQDLYLLFASVLNRRRPLCFTWKNR